MKTKTTKRNATRVAALTSALAIMGTSAAVPLNTANAAPAAEGGYAVDTGASGKQEFPGDNGSGWNLVGDACLTPGATGNGANCASSEGWHGDPEHGKGWIQLTDATMGNDPKGPKGTMNTFKNGKDIGPTSNANQRGSALYNTNIPAARGLDIQFEQVQGGGSTRRFWAYDYDSNKWTYILDPTRGADGIGFYLVDGDKTTSLTKPGSYGAGLGYTQGTADSGDQAEAGKTIDLNKNPAWDNPNNILREGDRISVSDGTASAVSGVDNGVLGVGLDSFGNFASRKYGLGYAETDAYKVPGSSAGYSWEQVALATATDASGKPACVRDIHPGNKPMDLSILGGLGEALSGLVNTDCTSKGLIDVKRKSSQFGETLYKTDFDPMPFRRIVADDEKSPLRFRGVDKDGNAGISYWEPRGDALSLRGPGNGIDGYQLLASRGYTGAPQDQGTLSETLGAKSFRAQPTTSTPSDQAFNLHPSTTHYKYVRVTIDPKTAKDSNVRVTVAASNQKGNFPTKPGANTAFLEASIPSQFIPDNYKFGFSASTGAGTDVHAIRDVKIKELSGGLKLEKNVAIEGKKAGEKAIAGDTLKYSFKVTNTGEAALSKVSVADPIAQLKCDPSDLAPGASKTCSGTHKLTAEDIANKATKNFDLKTAQAAYKNITGGADGAVVKKAPSFKSGFMREKDFVNTAVAYGLNTDSSATNGGMVFSNTDEAKVTTGTPAKPPTQAKPKPSISLDKHVKGKKKKAYHAGDKVPYQFDVTNTGKVKLTKVHIDDKVFKDAKETIKCDATELAPGASTSCYGTHALTKAEAKQNPFKNVATAIGTPVGKDGKPSGDPVKDSDDENIPTAPLAKGIKVTKDVDGEEKPSYKAGETVPYVFTVENTGKVKLSKITAHDEKFTDEENKAIKCKKTDLAPGEKTTCTGTHKLTDDDVATGTFHNTVTGTGTPPDGKPIKDTDEHKIPTDPERGLTLEKVVDEDSDLAKDKYVAGDKVPYLFTVKNSGKVDLVDIVVEDEALDEAATCEATDLAVGKSTTCKGVHTLTEEEVAEPEFENIAQAFGEDPTKDEDDPERKVPSNKDKAVVKFPNAELGLVKDIDEKSELAKSVYSAGDKIPYLLTVTNEGNLKIDNIAIEDKALDEPATCDESSLEAGESTECRGVHTLTEEEAAAGHFRNVATATGTDPNGDPVRTPEDEEDVPTSKNELVLDKAIDGESELVRETYAPGDKIPYLFNVKNAGTDEVHDVVVVDGAVDEPAVCDETTLASGAETTCRGVHTLTEAEAAEGEFINVAYASGLDPNGNPVNSNEDQEIVPTEVPRGPLASTGASVAGLAGLALISTLVGVGAIAIRRRNV